MFKDEAETNVEIVVNSDSAFVESSFQDTDIALFGLFILIIVTITKALNFLTKKNDKVWDY